MLIIALIISETYAFQYPIKYTRSRLINNGGAAKTYHHGTTSQSQLRTSSSFSFLESNDQTKGSSSMSLKSYEQANGSASLSFESQHEAIILDEINNVVQVGPEEVTDNTNSTEITKEHSKKGVDSDIFFSNQL